jgi:hypothetical protein
LSFRMDVKVEKVLEDGAYEARLVNVEQKETKFGDRLMWTFEVDGENTEVVGFTSMSPSTKAKAFQWAAAIVGEIDPRSASWCLRRPRMPRAPRRTRSSRSSPRGEASPIPLRARLTDRRES